MNQPILIIGTGALGTLFAARLAAAGHPVTMLGTWKEGLEAIRHYLRKELPNGPGGVATGSMKAPEAARVAPASSASGS